MRQVIISWFMPLRLPFLVLFNFYFLTMIPSLHRGRVLIFPLDLVMWQRNYFTHFLNLLRTAFYFDTAKMLLLRKLFLLPANLISSTFSCTFSMLHLINLNYSQLIVRSIGISLLPFNTHSPCFSAVFFYHFCFRLLAFKSLLLISHIIHSQV